MRSASLARMCAAVWVGVLLVSAVGSARAGEAEGGPVRMPQRGVCALVDQPAELAARLAVETPGLLVFAQFTDARQVEAARRAAEAAGVLGRRVFVDRIEAGRIALADNVVDAVLASGENPAIDRSEVLRVLRPGATGIIARSRLTKPVPAGTDRWSHPYHGPDNNPLSTDRLARAPYLTQFLAEPLFSSQPEVTVAAGGRVYKAFGHMTFRAYQNPSINRLFAMNGYNGTILWERDLKPGFMIHRNTFVATDDALLMGDDESCKVYDGATGQIRDQIVVPEGAAEGPVWKWMALENGILYALVGPKEVPAPVARGTEQRIGGWPWGMWPGYEYKDPKTAWGFGRTFLAFDLKTKQVKWRFQEAEPLDSRGLCLKNGRIYYYCPDKFLGCIDAGSGKAVWRTTDGALLSAIGPNEKAQHYVTGFSTSTYLKATDKVLAFAGPQRSALVVASVDDGKLLWSRKGGNFQLVLRGDAIYALGDQFGKSYKFDYMTGNVLGEFVGRRACTRATGTVDSVFCRATEGTIRWDMATGALNHLAPMRPACHDGVVVSDGLLYWGPWICGCHLTLVGAICLTPAGDFDFGAKVEQSRQLTKLAADGAQVKALNVAAGDWPTFQGDARRSATTGASVPANAGVLWQKRLGEGVVPTAPVSAGGMVFIAGTDGIVRAMDAQSGAEKWKAYTGGSVFFPPTVWNGRAYVGSNDGRVYAFEAATGSGLWSFRVAPTQRTIPVYGEFVSTWPVAGGVVVEDGTVYAAGGISHFDSTHVVALDAVSGQVKWANDSSGIVDQKVKNGISLSGPLTLENGVLSFAGGNVYVTAAYDIRDGRCTNQPAGARTARRIFLWPRKLWEPIDAEERATRQGVLRLRPGRRASTLGMYAPGSDRPNWSVNGYAYAGCAIAANAVVVLARTSETEDGKPAPWRATALRLADGAVMWSRPLAGAPVHWGVAIDSAGRVLVSQEDGQVVCFGS